MNSNGIQSGFYRNRLSIFLLCFLLLSAGIHAEEFDDGSDYDPWQRFNRKVFQFNEVMDRYIAKPVAKGYRWITPNIVDRGISNFFSNLGDIGVTVNDLLQGKFMQAGSDGLRFVVNSTLGIVGFFDVASELGLPKHHEDFGQTLGYWGVSSGPFLVLPFLGPSNIRDGTSLIVDYQLNPLVEVDHDAAATHRLSHVGALKEFATVQLCHACFSPWLGSPDADPEPGIAQALEHGGTFRPRRSGETHIADVVAVRWLLEWLGVALIGQREIVAGGDPC